MQVDSFFKQGASHKICEDYAIHGTMRGNPFIIVCDGCSGSKDTDFGARLMARSAKKALSELYANSMYFDELEPTDLIELFEKETEHYLRSALLATYSDISVADATLLVAFIYADKLYWYMRGDGAIAIKYRNGDLIVNEVKFHSGAPYYLSYDLSKSKELAYIEQFGTDKSFIKYNNASDTLELEHHCLPYHALIADVLDLDTIDSITLMSDGIDALQYKNTYTGERNVNLLKIRPTIRNALAFKNYNGEFVQRRMNRFMRDIDKMGVEPFDDISVATIWVGDEYATGNIVTPLELLK